MTCAMKGMKRLDRARNSRPDPSGDIGSGGPGQPPTLFVSVGRCDPDHLAHLPKPLQLYLTFMCTLCHGELFSGGTVPGEGSGAPKAPNLTRFTQGGWSEEGFIEAMRTGVTPGGRALDEEFMSWDLLANLTDDEIKAIWLFLASLEPRELEK